MRASLRLSMLAVPACLLLVGCGNARPRDPGPSATAIRRAFRGSPPAVAAVHAQAGRLLSGGVRAFRARLRTLRGHPVVVNEWGSWCEPCQSEFPVFQRVAVADGRLVAFLGVDDKDTNGAATTFLRRFPVTYPSYTDPHGAIIAALRTYGAIPQTFYFDRRGREVYDHAGSYGSVASLERDIRFYLHP